MKTISMDYDEFLGDLDTEHLSGRHCGVAEVMHWLESGEKLSDFLEKSQGIKDIKADSNWGRIAKALGRENELNADPSI